MSNSTTLGRYQIETFLGKGSFAEVYKATDTLLKRVVALKVLKPALMADEEAFARFTHEAQVLAGLVHTRIAWVWDLGEADGRYFIAMRYVEGKSMDKVLAERGALALNDVLKITKQVAEALEFAHEQELVHRDVKPQNIIISEKEGAVLTDFGLVKVMQSSGMTGTGSYLGTPQYMAPELWDGKEAGKTSDQYALACLVAEMLTGKTLFNGSTPVVIRKHLMEEPVLPSGLPEKVMEALRCALSKDPAKRHDSIHAFMDALTSSPEEPKTPAPVSIIRQEEEPQPLVEIIKEVKTTKTADAVARKIDHELVLKPAEDVEMTFVRVSAGEFLMGTGGLMGLFDSDESPQHALQLEEYWMGKAAVTNIQYRTFMTATGRLAPQNWKDGKIPLGKEKHPVVCVRWNDAIAFCLWISKVTGETIRLPSEAEWEKAARGSTGYTYPWGDQRPNWHLCNFNENEGDTTSEGEYSPMGDSPYGCMDMAGNVWEWTSSLYKPYPYNDIDGRENLDSLDIRVLRGGSWLNPADEIRSAFRSWSDPMDLGDLVGFRCTFLT